MFLQALTALYDRLADDPDSGVARPGYSQQQIAFFIVLNPDGSLLEVQDARVEDGKGKLRKRSVVVCGNSKPPGIGINPCFLWDNTAYALGYEPDDPKPERTREKFEAFRERHLSLEGQIDDAEYVAVCRFLQSWDTAKADEQSVLKELGTGFGVFQIRGVTHYVHESPGVRRWWEAQLSAGDGETGGGEADGFVNGQCFVTGEFGPIARLHEPKIKGVFGGQSSGATLVSFNFDAATSYGKEQSYNAPLSELAAFKYCTALNWLLDPARGRRLSIGDTSVVFWAEKPTAGEGFFAQFVSNSAEDEGTRNRVRDLIDQIAKGKYPNELGDPKVPFYVLGLSPNAARISVRFWHESTLGEMLKNLGQHFADLEIVRGPNDISHPSLWRLLGETVRDAKDILDLLEGAMLRAILTGRPYPDLFYSSLMRRVRADREMRYVRAAAIKACLNRNTRFGINPLEREIAMALDPDRPEPAYQLGRFFAELEQCQGEVGSSIKDRFFSSACATPGAVFPRLIKLNQHHLRKMSDGKRIYHERRLQEITSHYDEFPMHLSMRDQGLFTIGYYHQRQDLFTKKNKDAEAPAEAVTTEL